MFSPISYNEDGSDDEGKRLFVEGIDSFNL
jgi:hypothetical protein